MVKRTLILLATFALSAAAQQTKIAVTVFDEKTGDVVTGLTAGNFSVKDGMTTLRVESAEPSGGLLDLMLVTDTSVVGHPTKPFVSALIEQLGENEQMALVGYDQSATLLEDFTASKDALRQAYATARFGNNPRALDALYAVLDGGFEGTAGRRAVVLLTAGAEGQSRTPLSDISQMARRRGVRIHTVYLENPDAGLFEKVSERSGGAYFAEKKLKLSQIELARKIFAAVRGGYELTLSGVYSLGPRIEVEIVNPPGDVKKPTATVLPLD